ncbi:MAG: 30S ribosomal protein S6 [Desulfobacterales bacterium]
MKRYETIVILDPDLSEDQRRPVLDRIGELIPQQGGQLLKVDEWGVRKLAYEINKKPRGHYTLVDYCGGGPLVSEMERFFRIDDRVMKFMTVLTDPMVDPVKLAQEAAQAEEGQEQEAAQAGEGPAQEAAQTGDGQPREERATAAAEASPPPDDAANATETTESASPDVEEKEE